MMISDKNVPRVFEIFSPQYIIQAERDMEDGWCHTGTSRPLPRVTSLMKGFKVIYTLCPAFIITSQTADTSLQRTIHKIPPRHLSTLTGGINVEGEHRTDQSTSSSAERCAHFLLSREGGDPPAVVTLISSSCLTLPHYVRFNWPLQQPGVIALTVAWAELLASPISRR